MESPVAWFCGEEPVPLYAPVGDVTGLPLLAAAGLCGPATTVGDGGVLPVVVLPVGTPFAMVSLGPLAVLVLDVEDVGGSPNAAWVKIAAEKHSANTAIENLEFRFINKRRPDSNALQINDL